MGGLEVVTFEKCQSVSLEPGRHDRNVGCGGLVFIDSFVGKLQLRHAVD